MNIFIQYPTRRRPIRFKQYLLRYIQYISDKENFHIQISADIDDESMNNPDIQYLIKRLRNVSIIFHSNKTKVEAINRNIPAYGWDILLLASDDMWPEEYGYDDIIRRNMLNYFPDGDGVLHFNDGLQGEKLNTLPILGNKYYRRFGYIYNPVYKSLYCDNEFHDISKKLNKQKYIDQVIISHQRKSIKKDNLHRRNSKQGREDRGIYQNGKENNII